MKESQPNIILSIEPNGRIIWQGDVVREQKPIVNTRKRRNKNQRK